MKPIGSSWWEREIDIENLREIVEYKYFMKKNEIKVDKILEKWYI